MAHSAGSPLSMRNITSVGFNQSLNCVSLIIEVSLGCYAFVTNYPQISGI